MSGKDSLKDLIKSCIGKHLTSYPDDWCSEYEIDYDAIADHLLANGVIVLPCKVGDVVYGYHPANGTTILPMVAKWFETNEKGWTVAAQYVPMAPRFISFLISAKPYSSPEKKQNRR